MEGKRRPSGKTRQQVSCYTQQTGDRGGGQRGRLKEEAKGETKVGDQRVDQRRRLKGEAKGGGQREGASLVTHDAM